jgi:hypothetical protein
MLNRLRYILAAVCFTASVACLLLWWRSTTYLDRSQGPVVAGWVLDLASFHGILEVGLGYDDTGQIAKAGWMRASSTTERFGFDLLDRKSKGEFGYSEEFETLFFPHWYPALIFALAGIAALRLGRRFTIRSAIIATTVVAALLGTAVVM